GRKEVKDPNYEGNKDGEEFHQGEVIEGGGAADVAVKNTDDANASPSHGSVIAVLVFVCNRPSIKRNLDQLFKFRPSAEKFPIIVSQDCGSHPATTSIIKSFGDKITHIMQPDLSDIKVPPKEKKLKGYYNIARHYGWALNYTFNTLGHNNVLIVEDDLDIAPDFFEYFAATLPLLYEDPTLWCISAWNDNGKPKRINETAYDLLHRTDFFPGLGWLMTKSLWTELMVKWPKGYWDDWMREPPQRKDRSCIRPEISRTSTFGKDGVSHGTYYQNHLRFIKLNDHFVPFTSLDLSYLKKDKYDVAFVKRVYSSQLVSSVEELKRVTNSTPATDPTEFRLTYRTKVDFRIFAKKLEIMEDFRAGVPRTAYRGVVPFLYNNKKVYLAPGANWNSYQP
ncbi:Alpha-1,3-mannosyl-glycoprotein 2-beta-N-acetylglucosaminyltransferase, partial [Orchesella cincta]